MLSKKAFQEGLEELKKEMEENMKKSIATLREQIAEDVICAVAVAVESQGGKEKMSNF